MYGVFTHPNHTLICICNNKSYHTYLTHVHTYIILTHHTTAHIISNYSYHTIYTYTPTKTTTHYIYKPRISVRQLVRVPPGELFREGLLDLLIRHTYTYARRRI